MKFKNVFCVLMLIFMMNIFSVAGFANSYSNEKKINLNTSYTDNLKDINEHDYFKFTLPRSGKVSFNFKHNSNKESKWSVELIDSKNNLISSKIITSNTINFFNSYYSEMIPLKKGIYFLRVSTLCFNNDAYQIMVKDSNAIKNKQIKKSYQSVKSGS